MSLEYKVNEHSKKIAVLETRQNDHEKIATGLHELSKSVAAMAVEIKLSSENHSRTLKTATDNTNKAIEQLAHGQKNQGERIGAIEKSIQQIERNEKDIMDMAYKLDAVRMEPGKKWKSLVASVVCALAGLAVGALLLGNVM